MPDRKDESANELLARLCLPASGVPRPTAMLVLAHPGDEALGAGSLLPSLSLASFVYVTDGAPRERREAQAAGCATRGDLVARRRGELLSAFERVGIASARIDTVGCVEREAHLHLAALSRWLEILFLDHRPQVVLTHAFEGGDPDGDAAAFAVHTAAARIAAAGENAPVIAEFASRHAEAVGWPVGEFLLPTRHRELTRTLTADERTLKRTLLGCYAALRPLLDDLPLETEHFRLAPAYDFSQPPHPGSLAYETDTVGVGARQWNEAARAALEELNAEPTSYAGVLRH